MTSLPPLTRMIDVGAIGGHEFERLMNQILLCYADQHNFEYEPSGSAGGDRGIDGLARRGGVPGLTGPVAFQFKWLWGRIHKGNKAGQVTDSLSRAAQESDMRHWVLVTPHDLTPAESTWLLKQSPRADLTVHSWGQTRIENLLRDYCPVLFARYYPGEAMPLLKGYDGHDFREFAADYRLKVAIEHRRLRTIGLPPETLRERDAGTEVTLRRIFVPQNLMVEGERDRVLTLADLLREGRSCVLLGDPGMGKTTALCFAALLFCGEAELQGFTPLANVVPLLIPLRDFLRLKQERPDLDFLEYLAARARSDLSLSHAHRAFFEAALRMGEAVVLVDGLDEAGGEVNRRRLSTAIQTFQAEYPHCPCWVTSRVYGYTHDVRLPKDTFAHYRVSRLDDAQVDDFIARWYAIQYPDNPREQDERARSLRQAVHRSPSVHRLAGNPLLLTLMAFIHHGQRSLPQDRGELYEQCIQMLLRTWLEAKHEGGPSGGRAAEPHPFERLNLHAATQKDYLAHVAMRAQELNQAAEEDEARGLIRRADALDCLARRHLDRSLRTRPEMTLPEAREEMEHFLDYVSDRTGLLIDKGGGQLSFIHLSFQEYLAAWVFTCGGVNENEQREFFGSHLGQAAWEEVLLLRLYIILRLPGGGGENLFDSVISSLLRRLERHPAASGWLTLTRAVRDNLEFGVGDRNAILGQALAAWLQSPPRFEGDWFQAIEEACLFSQVAKGDLAEMLVRAWQLQDLSPAAACLHLLQRLQLGEGASQIDRRPDLLKDACDWLLQRAQDPAWRSTLSFLFGCVIDKYGSQLGLQWLQHLAQHTAFPAVDPSRRGSSGGAWNLAIVLGDCLEILAGREAAIPADLTRFFERSVLQAIEQEIAVKDRHTLATALGRLGDPRIAADLRVAGHPDAHAGYVRIPAGRYYVGDEKKAVDLDETFWLSKYPVTNSQYALFLSQDGYKSKEYWSEDGWRWLQEEHITSPMYWRDPALNAPNQPVVGVSWWEAEAFCKWAGGFLPTELHWEAAARGPRGLVYPWGDEREDVICNSYEAELCSPSVVGVFPRDRTDCTGVMDMAGNVLEWCQDVEASGRVIRGGCWGLHARICRAADRGRIEPQARASYLGFRVAAVPPGGRQQEQGVR